MTFDKFYTIIIADIDYYDFAWDRLPKAVRDRYHKIIENKTYVFKSDVKELWKVYKEFQNKS